MYKVSLYGQPNCADCRTAKSLLEENGISYVYYDITLEEDFFSFREDFPEARSVPQLYDEYAVAPIGGLKELRFWLSTPKS